MIHYIDRIRLSLKTSGMYLLHVLLTAAVMSVNGQDEPSQPNYTEDTLFNVDGNGNNIITRQFSDGQGRKLQSQALLNGTTKVLVAGTGYNGYDAVGRLVKTVKLFPKDNGGQLTYIEGDLYASANQYYQISPEQFDSAYSSIQYYNDPMGRTKSAGAPGVNFTATENPVKTWYFGVPGAEYLTEYFTNDGFLKSSLLSKDEKAIPLVNDILDAIDDVTSEHPDDILYNLTVTMDANENFSQVLKDALGNTIATWSMANDVQGEIVSRMFYDELGRLKREIPPPNGDVYVKPTTYSYNSLSQVESKTTPDAGTVYTTYDDVGRVYEVIDANHATGSTPAPNTSRLRYGYDKMGRNITISRYEPSNELYCTWARTIYDFPDMAAPFLTNSQFPPNQLELNQLLNGLTNTKGRVVASISYDQGFYKQRASASDVQIKEQGYGGKIIDLFSYDDEGRVIRKYKSIPGIPLQTIKYGYNLQGKIMADTIEFTGTQIRTAYSYNNRGQLEKITRNGKEFVRYTYDETGRMTDKTFLYNTPNQRTVNYTYTIRDWTKKIETDDAGQTFSEEICYETNDLGDVDGFTFEPQYNGNISRTLSHCNARVGGNIVDGANLDLFYSYDDVNRLIQARNNGTSSVNEMYNASFTYLNDGRILNKNEGTEQQGWGNYLYYIDEGITYTNKLRSIIGSGKGDATLANYIYDYNGNMVLDRSKKMAVEYDWRNMPVTFLFFESIDNTITTCEQVKMMCASTPTISRVGMLYDASGNRVKKENGNATVVSGTTSDFQITNTVPVTDIKDLQQVTVTATGVIHASPAITNMGASVPDDAFCMENFNGEMIALSGNGFQVLGRVIENSGALVENSDMTFGYAAQAGGTPSEPPKLAVNNHGTGVVVPGSMNPALIVENGTGYVDNSHVFVKNDGADPYELSYVNTAEGISRPNNSFEFYVKDHLGSTRIVLNENAQIQEAMSYLAYGAIKSLVKPSAENKARQKFTGKELDEDGKTYDEHGSVVCAGMMLNYFGARYYDAEIGLWSSCDPENQFNSPYLYVGNSYNPIIAIDDDGNWVWIAGGAAIGAIAGGTANLLSQGIANGFNNINYGEVAVAAVVGGVSGGLNPTTALTGVAGVASIVAQNVVKDAALNVVQGMVNRGGSATLQEVGTDAAMGGFASLVGSGIGGLAQKAGILKEGSLLPSSRVSATTQKEMIRQNSNQNTAVAVKTTIIGVTSSLTTDTREVQKSK